MLRITIEESSEALTFLVEGKLIGVWARELEQSWKEAASRRAQRAPIVDLTETLFIDEEGCRVLSKLFQEGAFFRTSGPMTEAIVSEITGKSTKAWHGAAALSILLVAIAIGARGAKPEAAPPPLRLTLRDAVEMTLKQNPQAQVANLSVAVAPENQIVERSARLPQAWLAVSEDVHRENLEMALGMSVPGFPEYSGPFWIFQGGSSGAAPVFDLAAWHRWRQSKENTTGSHAQEQTLREQNVLRSRAGVCAAQSRADLAKALFDQASDLQKNGVGMAVDALRANAQYQNEQQRLIDLADRSEFYRTRAFSAHETMEQAFAERPEMNALASQLRSTEPEKKTAQDEGVPRIALNSSWSEQGGAAG